MQQLAIISEDVRFLAKV